MCWRITRRLHRWRLNLFHLRGGRAVDRRDIYWEDMEEFDPKEFVPSLLKQIYLDAAYLPKAHPHARWISKIAALTGGGVFGSGGAQGGDIYAATWSKQAFLDLVENNAAHSFNQRFRVLKPTSKAITEAVQNALELPEEPKRIESFDISHIQGTDTVASMVVWENGRMKKADYRKFIIRGEPGTEGRQKTMTLRACRRR